MVQVTFNEAHSLLTIVFKDVVDGKQAEKLYKELQQLAPKLKKGFKILTDLSSLEIIEMEAHIPIEKAMDLCNQHGVSKVIRITPDPSKDIGFNIMSLFHYSQDVIIHTYKSFEEALEYLF